MYILLDNENEGFILSSRREVSTVKIMGASEARGSFAEILNEVHFGSEPIVVEKSGQQYAAIVDIDVFKALLAPERINRLKKLSSGDWETLEIISKNEDLKTITQGLKEVGRKKTVPIETLLE